MKKEIKFDKNGEILAPNKNIVTKTITRGKSKYNPVKATEVKSKVSSPKFTDKAKKEVKEERQQQLHNFNKQKKKK